MLALIEAFVGAPRREPFDSDQDKLLPKAGNSF